MMVENFDVSSEDPSSGFSRGYLPTKLAILTPDEGPSLETSKFSFYFFVNQQRAKS